MEVWQQLASLVIGVVLIIIGAGTLVATAIGSALAPLTLALLSTETVVLVIGLIAVGYSAWRMYGTRTSRT